MIKRLLAAFLLVLASLTGAYALTPVPPPLMEVINGEKPIQLQSLSIAGAVSGGMAQTKVRMVFFNPNSRPLEGNLQFPLLDGQQITAFALDIDGKLRPAVPVEKAKGRKIFEEIERRNVDPALLESTQGNNFKLRVYPIAAMGTRTVELQYAEALTREGKHWAYRLPLAYGSQLQDFDLSLKVNGSAAAPQASGALGAVSFKRSGDSYESHVEKGRFAPTGSLKLLVPASYLPQTYVQERDGTTYFMSEIPVSVKRTARPLPKVLGLLWDSSGSGAARDLARELIELDAYFKALKNAEVRLTRLRDRAEATQSFTIVNGNWDSLRTALESTVYDGASALADWQPQADVGEYLLVSDGLVNYGSAVFPVLPQGQRLYALNSALMADTSRLAALAERTGGRLVQVQPDKAGAAADALITEGSHVRTMRAVGATDLMVDSADPQQGMLRVAGQLSSATAQLTLTVVEQGKPRDIVLSVSANAPTHALAAHLWASYKLHALEADFEAHRAQIRRLGMRFGIPTRETSLIVLDRLDDYLRYDLAPPAALQSAFEAMKSLRGGQLAQQRKKHMDALVKDFEQKVAWWEKTYPKDAPPGRAKVKASAPVPTSAGMPMAARPTPVMAAPMAVAPPPPVRHDAARMTAQQEASSSQHKSAAPSASAPPEIGIALKKWTSNAPYMARLIAASPDTVYAVYLDEKPSYVNSTGFFLDVADVLIEKSQRELGLRVLSNLAEMDLENRHVLRLLGYRLMQAGVPELAIPVLEKVQRLAEEEPQSFRDLGLAHAAAGHHQQAIDQLNEVLLRPWGDRFAEIELIALAEMNAIIATAPSPLDTSRIDARLLKNLALDMRAVLTWDADNSDMDLHVTDPNGEECFYRNRFTYQGGRLSRDFTGGYGPEEFSLRDAKPGKYQVNVAFYGNRQQGVAGAISLQVTLSTAFGTSAQKDQTITLRLKGRGESEFVGEFEVKAK